MIIVEKKFFEKRAVQRDQSEFTSCLTTLCIRGILLYMETDGNTTEFHIYIL